MKKFFRIILTIFCVFMTLQKPALAIKIGLYDSVSQNYVAVSKKGYLVDHKTYQILYTLNPMKKYLLKKHRNSIAIQVNGKYYDLGTNNIIVESNNKGFVSTKSKWYRGRMFIKNNGRGLTFINDLTLEEYLLGVVPSEMPSTWNYEAQKAQAIAARSYAIANLGKRSKSGYDLKDTPDDQAYGGASSETKKTNSAVLNTKGIVITYNNKIIPPYYHSSSGGYTKNARQVWHKDLPYIRAVPGYDNKIRKSGHGIGMSQYGANNLASYGYNSYQILSHYYNNIKFSKVNTDL